VKVTGGAEERRKKKQRARVGSLLPVPYLQEEMVALVQPVEGAPDHDGSVGGRSRPSPLGLLLPFAVAADGGGGGGRGVSHRAHDRSVLYCS